jgi:flavodoxin
LIVFIFSLFIGSFHLYRVSKRNKKELKPYATDNIVYKNDLGKVLVVYYSLSGNTKQIAENIAKKTNADLFEIKTLEQAKLGLSFYIEIKKQLNTKKYPKIENKMPDFLKYDTIFVGFPVWWYTMATPGLSFLQKADFRNKNVVPFSTQGSNYGSFFEDFKKMAKNANILEGNQFNNVGKKYNNAVDSKISDWLNQI